MLTDADATLKNLPTAEVERQLDNVQDILLVESFGNDHEAYYELRDERNKLFQELKRRGK